MIKNKNTKRYLISRDNKKYEISTSKYKHGGAVSNSSMALLDHKGNIQMYLEGGELIFSRVSSKEIIDAASSAKTKEDILKLGQIVHKERMAQRGRDPEYVD